jgi:3-phosphoshikimate 1-carboxyvinyltransferase
MRQELSRLGVKITELPDGLVVEHSKLTGAEVDGHSDHRVAMALAVAGCSIPGQTVVRTAESATVTFPTFMDCMRKLGADIRTSD